MQARHGKLAVQRLGGESDRQKGWQNQGAQGAEYSQCHVRLACDAGGARQGTEAAVHAVSAEVLGTCRSSCGAAAAIVS